MKEDQSLKQLAKYMVLIMVLLLCFSVALDCRVVQGEDPEQTEKELLMREGTEQMELPSPTPTPPHVEAVMQGGHAEEAAVWEIWQFLQHASVEELVPSFGERCILIKKTDAMCTYEVEEDILAHSFVFRIDSDREHLQEAAILRVQDDVFSYGELTEGEFLTGLGLLKYEEDGSFVTEVSFVPDGYYVPQVTEEDEYYIINLKKYKEVYDKIVVLDAGHGGSDPGAGAENYRIKESHLALNMVLYLKELLEENTDITVFCTRTDDVKLELAERVELALGVEADLFVSFHCNASEGKSRNGTEVIYNALQGPEDDFNSADFARICLDNLVEALGTKSNGIVDRQGLHIVRRATMPIAYLETAYLSNAKDLAILKDAEKQKAIAMAVYESILEAYERMGEE